MGDYLKRRTQLGVDEVAGRLLRSARLSQLLVDTGVVNAGDADFTSPDELGRLAGAEAREVVRLEQVAEQLASTGVGAAEFASTYTEALVTATSGAVAVKSILAYRHGFAIESTRPDPAEVQKAAGAWLARSGPPRLDDPVLLRFVLWCGVDRGLPIQLHAGFGDRDVHLGRADPALLQPFLEAAEYSRVPIVLLHCYPYHRQAGWLAQVYPHVYVDVGLTIAQVGARAGVVLAEFFELAPFGKLMFSTDGYTLPELYLVGAVQFRSSFSKILRGWVADGAMPHRDAERVASDVGSANARRLYDL
jgi:predicted TIM-barrel fold metal-dependent hydrolase